MPVGVTHGLANLTDTQSKEVLALFDLLDTDRDGLIDPKSARHICARLGFHMEAPTHRDDPGASPVSRDDLLVWLDGYYAQAQAATSSGAELRLSKQYALLRSFDLFGGGTQNRVTRKSMVNFLTQEQHKVRPEVVSKLLDEFGDGFTLTRLQLQDLLREQLRRQQGARLAAAQNAR